MFKLASLIAIAAATETAAEEKTKAEANLKKAQAKLGKALKTGGSKVGTLFTMPYNTDKAPTFTDLTTPHQENCNQCVFAGGDWSTTDGSCAISATKREALKKANGKTDDVEGTDVAATVDADLTYKAMFTGVEGCNDWVKVSKSSQEADYALVNFTPSTSKDKATATAANDAATLKGKAATVQSTGVIATTFDAKKFDSDKKDSFKVDWDTTSDDKWGAARIVMPHSFAGGMYMSLVNDDHTNVAIKVQGVTNRYFDGASAIAANIGKTDKFPLMAADSIEFIMQKKSTWTDASKFSVTYTRASYMDIAKFTAEHGGAVVWIIVGVVLVLAVCAGVIIWKMGKCCFGDKKGDEDKFYEVEDCYARV